MNDDEANLRLGDVEHVKQLADAIKLDVEAEEGSLWQIPITHAKVNLFHLARHLV